MDTYLKNIINSIKIHLNNNKPGEKAQKLMMPEGRILSPEYQVKPIPSAVLIALFIDKNQLYFPIIRRPVYNGMHSGQIAFPGGKRDSSDSNLIHTALREANEEIGIIPDEVEVLGTLTQLYIPITNMNVLPVVGYLKTKPSYILNKHEVDAIYNINIKDIFDFDKKITETWNLRHNNINVPFYNINKQKIWGATAMIISEFEQLLRGFSKFSEL